MGMDKVVKEFAPSHRGVNQCPAAAGIEFYGYVRVPFAQPGARRL